MAAIRSDILTWLSDLATAIVTDAIDLADIMQRISAALDLLADEFATEALSLMRAIAESASTPTDFGRISLPSSADDDTLDAARVLVAVGLSIAGPRVDWPSRPSARGARTRVTEAGEAALTVASSLGANGADLFGWISSVVSTAVRVISDIAANSVPVVRVQTGISLPSTLLAYQLYGDATRAQGVVDISRSSTPLLMPVAFDALAR